VTLKIQLLRVYFKNAGILFNLTVDSLRNAQDIGNLLLQPPFIFPSGPHRTFISQDARFNDFVGNRRLILPLQSLHGLDVRFIGHKDEKEPAVRFYHLRR
jgi:hypothetical protein